jgi:hypothetical protein
MPTTSKRQRRVCYAFLVSSSHSFRPKKCIAIARSPLDAVLGMDRERKEFERTYEKLLRQVFCLFFGSLSSCSLQFRSKLLLDCILARMRSLNLKFSGRRRILRTRTEKRTIDEMHDITSGIIDNSANSPGPLPLRSSEDEEETCSIK